MGVGKETSSPGCPAIPRLFCPTPGGVFFEQQINIGWLCFHESECRWLQGHRAEFGALISSSAKTSYFTYHPLTPSMQPSVRRFSLESGATYL